MKKANIIFLYNNKWGFINSSKTIICDFEKIGEEIDKFIKDKYFHQNLECIVVREFKNFDKEKKGDDISVWK